MSNKLRMLQRENLLSLIPEKLLNIRAWLIATPFSIIATLTTAPADVNQNIFSHWLPLSILGHLVMLPFIIYAQSGKSLKVHLILLLLMGAVRGIVIALFAPILNLNDVESLATRTLASSFAVFYWFIFIGIYFEVVTNFQQELRTQVKNRLKNGTVNQHFLVNQRITANQNRIEFLVSKLQLTLSSSGYVSSEINQKTKDIDTVIDSFIRPQSKLEWKKGEISWPRIGLQKLLRQSLTDQPLPVLPIIILTSPLTIVGQIGRLGFYLGGIIFVLSTLIAYLGTVFVSITIPLRNSSYFLQNVVFIVYIVILDAPLIYWVIDAWPVEPNSRNPSQIAIHILNYIFFISINLLAGIAIFFKSQRAAVLELIKNQLEDDSFSEVLADEFGSAAESEYAQYLHAQVQSQLIACKLILMKVAESNFKQVPPEIVKIVLDRLQAIKEPYQFRPHLIARDRIAALPSLWQGLATFEMEICTKLDEDSGFSNITAQLIEESVINAIRHGKAKRISIEVLDIELGVRVAITDDGKFAPTLNSGGLGTILFQTFAEDWEIIPGPEGTTVVFKVLE